ncbi:hypothetical protein BLNAU_9372 [Blattamonas nauphoetae]|uniref:Protein kinase domain-containing protein n=1 Tax=Blattamonas nauphoetae TaxID=2049346 RepID=A0ABQ9XW15_9EUKA|nr:hypothetical protein BLNAU_9372 [Blattamonas nauphoetae]
MKKCSISSESGQLRGLVETTAFPDCGALRSISIVDCSFNSQEVLGTDGIGLSLTRTPRKSAEDVGIISPSLIGCSFVNMSSISSSRQPKLSHLSQKMLGCVVSLTSSHLSGSTIRDVNNGGSVLCSNSSFSSLLSSPNTDSTQGTVTLPNGTFPFVDNGTVYFSTYETDDGNSFASFSHCHFTGANYASNERALTFLFYPGAITITSCSFADHTVIPERVSGGGALWVNQYHAETTQPLIVEKSNFTNIKTIGYGAGMAIEIDQPATIDSCKFERCGPPADGGALKAGGLYLYVVPPCPALTVTNLDFESCSASFSVGGMWFDSKVDAVLSDWIFNDCSSIDPDFGQGGLHVTLYGYYPTEFTRLTFTDCSGRIVDGMYITSVYDDVKMTDVHFFRCQKGLYSVMQIRSTLTLHACSFVECSSKSGSTAFGMINAGSCVISDCLVKDCSLSTTGAITITHAGNNINYLVSLTRVAFVNNSVGQIEDSSLSMNSTADTTVFVDVHLKHFDGDPKPTISVVECFTTCATNSIGMHMIVNRYTPEESRVRIDDEAFNNVGPLLTEAVELSFDSLTGRMELEMKGKMPIASQKYEVTFRNEGDKTDVKGVIEFVNGKGTLTSPSPSLTLDYSTSYTITSIVGIVPSSSSSLSNALTFPQAEWAFNLASTPSFLSFTTPEQPPTLVGAKASLDSSNESLAFIILMLSEEVTGSYEIVVEEEGKDIVITVNFDESSKMGVSSNFVVVGEDRKLTHDTNYTIKSITPSPDSESPFVWMNETIIFHIPKSSFYPKKAMSPETKKLLSWLIPLVACLLIALLVVIVLVVLLRRRLAKSQANLKEMEDIAACDQPPLDDEKVEIVTDNQIGVMSIQTCASSESKAETKQKEEPEPSDEVIDFKNVEEALPCCGDMKTTVYVSKDRTLYNALHSENRWDVRVRQAQLQLVRGLKGVSKKDREAAILRALTAHNILFDSKQNVCLKLNLDVTPQVPLQNVTQPQLDQQDSPQQQLEEGRTVETNESKQIVARSTERVNEGVRWFAPEVIENKPHMNSGHGAVFSLGLILWEMETGYVPFGEQDAVNASRQIVTGVTPKLELVANSEMRELIEECLSLNPEDRPDFDTIESTLAQIPADKSIHPKAFIQP